MKFLTALFMTVFLAFTSMAHADDNKQVEEAKAYVENVAQQALDIINDPNIDTEKARVKFQKIMNQSFDIKTIARFTLGRYWRVATAEQKKEYTSLIKDVILNKYADRLLDYSGDSFEITGGRSINKTDSVVTMKVKPKGQSEAIFAWRVRHENNRSKIIDLAVEGVSMSVTHRSDFSAVIQRNGGNVQALIDALKDKKI